MKKITPTELKSQLNTKEPITLIDVREIWERELFNIGGSHIPMGDLMTRKDEIPQNGKVVLYCEKGIRSVIAIQRLEAAGYNNLYNLEGGMAAWKKIA